MESVLTPYERLSKKSLEVERLERELATLRERVAAYEITDTVPRSWLDEANKTIECQRESIAAACNTLSHTLTDNERLKGRIEYDKAHRAQPRVGWRTSALVLAMLAGAGIMAAIIPLIM